MDRYGCCPLLLQAVLESVPSGGSMTGPMTRQERRAALMADV